MPFKGQLILKQNLLVNRQKIIPPCYLRKQTFFMIYGLYSTNLDKFKLACEFEMDPSFNFSCQLRQLLARQPSRHQAAKEAGSQASKQAAGSRQSGSRAVRQLDSRRAFFSHMKEKLSYDLSISSATCTIEQISENQFKITQLNTT